MKILKFLIPLVMMAIFQNSFAANTQTTALPVYITNHTSHTLHLRNTLYTTTPFYLDIDTIAPHSEKVKVATIHVSDKGEANIAFLVALENDYNGYTPLISQLISPDKDSMRVKNMHTCLLNRRNDCILVDFNFLQADLDFDIIPYDMPQQEQIQRDLKAKWSHVRGVTANFDFDKNEMTVIQKR